MRYLLILILCSGCTQIVTDKVYFIDPGTKVKTVKSGEITVDEPSVLIKETTLRNMFNAKVGE